MKQNEKYTIVKDADLIIKKIGLINFIEDSSVFSVITEKQPKTISETTLISYILEHYKHDIIKRHHKFIYDLVKQIKLQLKTQKNVNNI